MKMALAFALLLVGCGLIQTGSSGSSSMPAPASGGSPMPAGGGAPAPAGGGDPSGMVTMPNLVGMTVDRAAAAVRAAGFKLEMEHSSPLECTAPPKVDDGHINCQSVDAGTSVKAYTLIQVAVYQVQHLTGIIVRSQLKPMVGMKLEAAKAELKRLGYKGHVQIETPLQFYKNCPLGIVCEVNPESGVSSENPEENIFFVMNKNDVKISTPDP
ncbi:hypothetical protein BH11MYX1_BH11MYX1_44090 [soil metagenome]